MLASLRRFFARRREPENVEERAPAPSERRRVGRARTTTTTFDALPNDLIVSIFDHLQGEEADPYDYRYPLRRRRSHLSLVRETFPCVCREWNELYNTQQASPLHETLEIDFWRARDASKQRVRAAWQRAVSWARRHARDVRRLRIVGQTRPRPFFPENLTRLMGALAPHLEVIEVLEGSLVPVAFWESMASAVAPVGRLRKLEVWDIDVALTGDRAGLFARLTRLEELALHARCGDSGFHDFPTSLLELTNLRRLELSGHRGVTSVPSGILALQRLEHLGISDCDLLSLPEELGALSALTSLDVSDTPFSGTTADVAFPADALRGLTSLRRLALRGCALSAVPSFIGGIRSLVYLDLRHCKRPEQDDARPPPRDVDLPAPPPPPEVASSLTYVDLSSCSLAAVPQAVLSSISRVRVLKLDHNKLTSLPEDMGQRLPDLREIYLRGNLFTSLPLGALVGAASLEVIDFRCGLGFRIEQPLVDDTLLESFPRLRSVQMLQGHWHTWSETSRAHLERFAARLKERNPAAVVEF